MKEATAFGAALMAGAAVGIFKVSPDRLRVDLDLNIPHDVFYPKMEAEG